jgi:ribosome-binding protein aMBF1 (putative translation factor)
MNFKQKKHSGSSFVSHLKESLNDPVFADFYAQEQIKAEIADLVKKVREKAGLTQRQLANITGLQQSAIARIESRSSKMVPGIEILRKIFLPLGFNISLHLDKLKKAA